MEKEAGVILLVQLDIEPVVEREFNEWYNTEHIPKFMKVPGVLSAKRGVLSKAEVSSFQINRDVPKYITVYEYTEPSIMDTKEYLDVLETEWSKKLKPYIKNFSLTLYDHLGGW